MVYARPAPRGGAWPRQPFALDGWTGELASELRPMDVAATIERLVDPAHAVETVHWGRNYLYRAEIETVRGPLAVVVKQFRNQGPRKRIERRWKGSKAERSWRRALDFTEAGVPTALPVAWIESTDPEGPSFFVTRHAPGMIESRHVLRALNDDALAERFPSLDREAFLDALGTAIRRLHGAGLFHRDLSIGNVLLPEDARRPTADDLLLIDLNRARRRARVNLHERHRDLCRLTLFRDRDRRRFLRAYWADGSGGDGLRGDGSGDGGSGGGGSSGDSPALWQWLLYLAYHRGFYGKLAVKRWLRAPLRARRGLTRWFEPRRAHAHIPDAPADASTRDRIVWDHLSDQPHQHASQLEKLRVRLADLPSHLRTAAIVAGSAPRVALRHRALERLAFRVPRAWPGLGVCVRPFPERPTAVLEAVEALGARQVLLRLHPWQEEHDDEEALARMLHDAGLELTFALPQTRELVRDPALWRRRVEELAERFVPYGRSFQVGQAINRSKWGVWRSSEYFELAHLAVDALRRFGDVTIVGPAVIDFEPHAMLATLHDPRCPRFDAASSLLYVDRRGAPEAAQLGFDTVGKAALARAIAETSGHCPRGSWITEVNWPLWEGPHSPAGKEVSVDEERQADYLVRYALLALGSGMAARVYWWRLIARGYGLIAPNDSAGDADGLRRRPSFEAFAHLQQRLTGARFEGRLTTDDDTYALLFTQADGGETVVAWTLSKARTLALPRPASVATDRTGRALDGSIEVGSRRVEITGSPRFFSF